MNVDDSEERPSKSARKREHEALLRVADRMSRLTDGELQRLGVAEPLRHAIGLVRPMRASGARNRQLKHCVKFMHDTTLTEVLRYLDDQQSQQVAANRRFHEIERLRDQLISEGDVGLQRLFVAFPALDRQHLRHLCRAAAREKADGEPGGAGRKLFRYLRDELGERYQKK